MKNQYILILNKEIQLIKIQTKKESFKELHLELKINVHQVRFLLFKVQKLRKVSGF